MSQKSPKKNLHRTSCRIQTKLNKKITMESTSFHRINKKKTKNVFFIKDHIIKLVQFFINRTNSTNYNGTFQLTFANDILIQTIFYIMPYSIHKQTLHSVFHQLMSIVPCDFTEDISSPYDIFENLKAFTLSQQIIYIHNSHSETCNNMYPIHPTYHFPRQLKLD